jgi:hypothetical protein
VLARARRLVARRASLASAWPAHPAGRALGRRVLALARAAGARRDRRLLESLDRALARLRAGVAVGAERELADVLDGCAPAALDAWTQRHPVRHPGLRGPTLEVLLVGTAVADER